MIIGVPKEVKNQEYRVGLTPNSVQELVKHGHEVVIQTMLGDAIGFTDEVYKKAGAKVLGSAKEVFEKADMIVKVKEPFPEECKMLREGQILFTYLHLAALPEVTQLLQDSKCTAIAYETITDNHNRLPLLAPMSEVAGRMSIHVGNYFLHKANGGSGVLLSGLSGVQPGNVVLIGAGVVGANALLMAYGLSANVTIIDRDLQKLRDLDNMYHGRVTTLYSTEANIAESLKDADLVVGSVLIPGAGAPKLVTKEMIKSMKKGSVMVDVAIDQGGCFETSRPTTHDEPTYVEEGIVHYCVANMPGAMAKTSSQGLNNATLPHVLKLANEGLSAVKNCKNFANGLSVHNGHITFKAIADAFNKEYVTPTEALK